MKKIKREITGNKEIKTNKPDEGIINRFIREFNLVPATDEECGFINTSFNFAAVLESAEGFRLTG